MAFSSGRMAYVRFRVSGNAPVAVDQSLLDVLAANAFKEVSMSSPDEVHAGWLAGEHLYDTQFSYEKNAYGDMAWFAMRVDRNAVPADVKRAYKAMQLAAVAGHQDGPVNRSQRREAEDLADRQLRDEMASGKHRRSKLIEVCWDLRRGEIVLGASGQNIIDELIKLFRATFSLSLELLTAGRLAADPLLESGRSRDLEDLRPSPFTAPPPQARVEDDGEASIAIPSPPWTRNSLDNNDYLGNEWLLWLWYSAESDEGLIELASPKGKTTLAVAFQQTMEMECAWGAAGRQSLRMDHPSHAPEAAEALRQGKWPRKAAMILADVDGPTEAQFQLTLQADKMIVTAARVPDVDEADSPRAIMEHRLGMLRQLSDWLDASMRTFIGIRASGRWATMRQAISDWIRSRKRKSSPVSNEPGDGGGNRQPTTADGPRLTVVG